MDKTEFDKFADKYRALHTKNIRLSGELPEYFAEYKVRDVADLVSAARMRASSILDIGAGVGTSVQWFRQYFPAAALTCLDVSERSLEVGAARYPGEAEFVAFDGRTIPHPDGQFDLAFAACVFHHIDHNEHVALLKELHRVLAPNGMLAVFEHNPMNPLTVSAVNNCPFDENAKLIGPWTLRRRLLEAGFKHADLRFRIFFPGALRAFRPLEKLLHWCPAGAQYSVVARRNADH